jgi:hypothetical protein
MIAAGKVDEMPRRARSESQNFRNTKLPRSETMPTGVQCFNKNILSVARSWRGSACCRCYGARFGGQGSADVVAESFAGTRLADGLVVMVLSGLVQAQVRRSNPLSKVSVGSVGCDSALELSRSMSTSVDVGCRWASEV